MRRALRVCDSGDVYPVTNVPQRTVRDLLSAGSRDDAGERSELAGGFAITAGPSRAPSLI